MLSFLRNTFKPIAPPPLLQVLGYIYSVHQHTRLLRCQYFMFLPCSYMPSQRKETKAGVVSRKKWVLYQWAGSSFSCTPSACVLCTEVACGNTCSLVSSQWKASLQKCLWALDMREAAPGSFRKSLADSKSLRGWRDGQAVEQRCAQLLTASHCHWEGGHFLFTESFPLFCSSFLMINAPFIILTNSTLILEILSLIEISLSESSGKNVFSSWERTLPSEFPEPRAPPRQRPPAAPRDRKRLATWHPQCLRRGKETSPKPDPSSAPASSRTAHPARPRAVHTSRCSAHEVFPCQQRNLSCSIAAPVPVPLNVTFISEIIVIWIQEQSWETTASAGPFSPDRFTVTAILAKAGCRKKRLLCSAALYKAASKTRPFSPLKNSPLKRRCL